MVTLLRKLPPTLLASLLALTTLVTPVTPATATASTRAQASQEMSDGLMSAFSEIAALTYLEQKVIASGAAGDSFGWSAALSGDTALVGAYRENVGVYPDQGSVYVFTRSQGTWSLQQKLTASDGGDGD